MTAPFFPSFQSSSRTSASALVASVFMLALLGASHAHADTPDPVLEATEVTLVVNDDYSKTVTVRGKWQWTTHRSDCNNDRFAVGWAMDWNDPEQGGNFVGTLNNVNIHVGAAVGNGRNPADNSVHYYPGNSPARCGVYGRHGSLSYNTGDWGPISHTYKDTTDMTQVTVCVVMYDIHPGKAGHPSPHHKHGEPAAATPKESDLLAGGNGHNHDNSVQDNANTPLGNQCVAVPVGNIPTKTLGR